jgi:hypothetical protein
VDGHELYSILFFLETVLVGRECGIVEKLVYTAVLKVSYIMHDDVLKKIKPVTIRLKSNHKKSELNNIMSNLLQDYGISIEKKDKYILFRLSES